MDHSIKHPPLLLFRAISGPPFGSSGTGALPFSQEFSTLPTRRPGIIFNYIAASKVKQTHGPANLSLFLPLSLLSPARPPSSSIALWPLPGLVETLRASDRVYTPATQPSLPLSCIYVALLHVTLPYPIHSSLQRRLAMVTKRVQILVWKR